MFHFYKKKYGVNKRKAVILLSGWQSTQTQYWIFSKLLEFNGYYCLTYTYDKQILSLNTQTTVNNVKTVTKDILDEVFQLKSQGINNITLFATSLGTVPAILAAAKTNEINALILNTSGYDFAEIVWSWDKALTKFKVALMKQGISKKQLAQEWADINPKNNLSRLAHKKILLLSSKVDRIIPFKQSEKLYKAIKLINNTVDFKTTNHFGHYFYGLINLFKASSYLSFVWNN